MTQAQLIKSNTSNQNTTCNRINRAIVYARIKKFRINAIIFSRTKWQRYIKNTAKIAMLSKG